MPLSTGSKIKDLMASPAAREILDKHAPGVTTDKRIEMAMSMTLKSLAPFSQGLLSNAKLRAIDEDLKKLESA
jgi:hypothetical protein